MAREIETIMDSVNQGVKKDRVDMTDLACIMLYLFGIHRDDAYYITKCKGMIADGMVTKQATAYFAVDNHKQLIDALRPFVDARKEKRPSEEGFTKDWADIEIESLTAAELEKIGTYMLRQASLSSDTNGKEMNDIIKMLDSIGALPKKTKEEKEFKQVIINPIFNDICPHCHHEVYINHNPENDIIKQ